MRWYQWYFEVVKKYAVFKGRASRSEFWYFVLMSNIICVLIFILDLILQTGVLLWLYILFILLPTSSVIVRRLHDSNGSVHWFGILLIVMGLLIYNIGLICLVDSSATILYAIPLSIFVIFILLFTTRGSQPGSNRYGENPKIAMSEIVINTDQN